MDHGTACFLNFCFVYTADKANKVKIRSHQHSDRCGGRKRSLIASNHLESVVVVVIMRLLMA